MGIIFLVYLLSIVMEKLKNFEGMIYSLQNIIKDYRLVMILISSFVALLPIQGGAIFSAPMIKSIGVINHVSAEKNMFINYWFRHICLFIWPLYPEIILYSSLVGISLKNLIVILSPFAVIAFLVGTIWVYRNLNYQQSHQKNTNDRHIIALRDIVHNTWPVLVVILFILLLNVNLLLALFLVIIALFVFNSELRNQAASHFIESIGASYKTLLMFLGIFIFKGMLEYSQVVDFLPEYFLSIGIPINGILILVPF